MVVNTSRTWFVVERLIGEQQWQGKVGTLAGCSSPARLRDVLASDTRDVLVFAPAGAFIVEPKSAKKLGLLAGLRAAAGNASGLGAVRAIPKAAITGFSVGAPVPGMLDRGAGLVLATVTVREGTPGGDAQFVVDPTVVAPGSIADNVSRWLEET